MHKPFTFIHAADLHIDSPFKGVTAYSDAIAKQLRDATLKSYQNIVDLCIEVDAKFLIVAGDVYDGADRSIHAQFAFLEGLNKLSNKGISSFIAHGNHDPLEGWCNALEFPKHAHVFPNRVESQLVSTSDGEQLAYIAGVSYPRSKEDRNLVPDFARLDLSKAADLFKIAVLHCNVGGDATHANYAPCTLQDLTRTQFNYWALGHVHERKILSTNPWVCYSGNSQGRSIRERGARGCYVVTVKSPTDVEIEFQDTDTIRWFTSEVPINGITNLNELEVTIISKVNELVKQAEGRPLICRLSLTGRGPIYEQLHRTEQLLQFRDHCRAQLKSPGAFRWIEQLDFDCMPDVDFDEVRTRKDLVSFVLNEADQLRATNLKDSLMPVIGPLFQHSQASHFLTTPDDEQLNKLLDEAALLCFDKLENG